MRSLLSTINFSLDYEFPNTFKKILHYLLRIAQQKGISMDPKRLTCDFDLAAINAFKNIFHQTQFIQMCL